MATDSHATIPPSLAPIFEGGPVTHKAVQSLIASMLPHIRAWEGLNAWQKQSWAGNDKAYFDAVMFLKRLDKEHSLRQVSVTDGCVKHGETSMRLSDISAVRIKQETTNEYISHKPGVGRYVRLHLQLAIETVCLLVSGEEYRIPRSIINLDRPTEADSMDLDPGLTPIFRHVSQTLASQIANGEFVSIAGVEFSKRGMEFSKGLLWAKKLHRLSFNNTLIDPVTDTKVEIRSTIDPKVRKKLSIHKWNVFALSPVIWHFSDNYRYSIFADQEKPDAIA